MMVYVYGTLETWSQNNLKSFQRTSSFSPAVMEVVKPIYTDMADINLLGRCIGGLTPNSDESFNQSVCSLVPKTFFSDTENWHL